MRFSPGLSRTFAVSIFAILLAGCLDKVEHSNFAQTTGNRAPTIFGAPRTSITVGQNYSFVPDATDPDGDSVTFRIANMPAWASFDSATGQLSGTPANPGTHQNIRISVSDRVDSSSLDEFSISVMDDSGAPSNSAPTITGNPASNVQVGESYEFQPTATDADGDVLTFNIVNQPAWAAFDMANGRLSGTPTNTGTFQDIRISVSDGQATAGLAAFSIDVTDDNNAPTISGSPPTTANVGDAYTFTPTAADADGDTLTFAIANPPVWASFNTATGELSGTPPSGSAGNYANIVISVSDGEDSSRLAAFAIDVSDDSGVPTNNVPTISGNPATSIEAGENYDFTPSAADADGDTLTFSIINQPGWASFNTATGRLSGTPATAGNFADIQISVTDGQANASLASFSISVTARNSAPTISGNPTTSVEAGNSYDFTPNAADADGDTLTFGIVNQPGWASFNTATGRLSGTPADAGNFANIQISVSDGQDSASLASFSIDVSAGNSAPTISGNPTTSVEAGNSYDFTPNAADADGDTLTFSIINRPGWASFNTSTGQLSGTPANAGNFANIQISVTDGRANASLAAFSINVTDDPGTPTNNAPTISGNPATSIEAGESYDFIPNAADGDGDTLTFSIVNRPDWASFNTATGQLSGTPANAGNFADIQISVTDGQDNASLAAFSIDVTSGNSAPTISGNPATSVKVGEAYVFMPGASDANGDTLTFSIANKPAWAAFNSGTGRLSGTPADGDIGIFAGILISVTDGENSASLASFQIDVTQVATQSATLNWTAPTQNEDGTPLNDLAGYKLYYGRSSRNYTNVIDINNPGVTTYVIDNLSPDTYYFAATAINSSGVESRLSDEAVKDLN